MKQKIKNKGPMEVLRSSTILSALLAFSVGVASVTPAYAFISNTATARGEAPGGDTLDPLDDITDTDSVDVSVEPDDPELTITKTAVLSDTGTVNGLGDAGEIITYTYEVENSGNTTVNSVSIIDTHDGSDPLGTPVITAGSAVGTPGASTVDLLPTEIATFEITYTITAADIAASGGGAGAPDGDLDNSAVAEGTYPDGGPGVTVTSTADTAEVPLSSNPSLSIAKAAYDDGVPATYGGGATGAGAALGTGSDVAAGTFITYVYEVTNDGDVPIESVGVTDAHGGTGTLSAITLYSLVNTSTTSLNDDSIDGDPNVIDILQPGDVAVFTATYTVTQEDIDTLQ